MSYAIYFQVGHVRSSFSLLFMNIKLYVISIFKHASCCTLHMLINNKDIGRYRNVFSSDSLILFCFACLLFMHCCLSFQNRFAVVT